MRFFWVGLVCIWASVAAAQTIEFKGVALGSAEKDFHAKNPGYRCVTVEERFRRIGDRTCRVKGITDTFGTENAAGTFADVPADIDIEFYNDRLAHVAVSFKPANFEEVRAALINRYGKPDASRSEVVKNRMGAEFLNVMDKWSREETALVLVKYGSDVTRGRVSYSTDWAKQEFKRRTDETNKKASRDL